MEGQRVDVEVDLQLVAERVGEAEPVVRLRLVPRAAERIDGDPLQHTPQLTLPSDAHHSARTRATPLVTDGIDEADLTPERGRHLRTRRHSPSPRSSCVAPASSDVYDWLPLIEDDAPRPAKAPPSSVGLLTPHIHNMIPNSASAGSTSLKSYVTGSSSAFDSAGTCSKIS